MAAATRVFDKDEDGFLTVSYEQKYRPKKTGKDVKKIRSSLQKLIWQTSGNR
jgi:hypothetical protein